MSEWLTKTLKAEVQSLLPLAGEDDDLRAELRALAQEILAATEPPPARGEPAKAPAQGPQEEPRLELTLGQRRTNPDRHAPVPEHPDSKPAAAGGSELDRLEFRCRRKAEAARWAAESQRFVRERGEVPAPVVALDGELADWAAQWTDALCWVSQRDTADATDIAILDDLAGCFETLAEALALVREAPARSKAFDRAIRHLAEAQSALRRALGRLDIGNDSDQEAAFEWVRAAAARQRIYLERHMCADDLADPTGWRDLLTRMEHARSSGRWTDEQTALLETARQHGHRLAEGAGAAEDWLALAAAVAELVAHGMPPSTRELRDLLLPLVDEIPDRDDLPVGFQRVLREIDRFLATRGFKAEPAAGPEPTAEVQEAARLLNGKAVVLIGGSRRRDAQETLRRALGLTALVWIETREHQPVSSFEPVIARGDVALVLLAIRWSSHSFGEVRHLCERHGKPLVRLPGGYSLNQVAAQVLAQASQHLGMATP